MGALITPLGLSATLDVRAQRRRRQANGSDAADLVSRHEESSAARRADEDGHARRARRLRLASSRFARGAQNSIAMDDVVIGSTLGGSPS
jgi:hypothetical protein